MKAYLITIRGGTFGQTGAVAHAFAGQESVTASVGLDSTDTEIAAFMAVSGRRMRGASRLAISTRINLAYQQEQP